MDTQLHLYGPASTTTSSASPGTDRVALVKKDTCTAADVLSNLIDASQEQRDAVAAALTAVLCGAPIAVFEARQSTWVAALQDHGPAWTVKRAAMTRYRHEPIANPEPRSLQSSNGAVAEEGADDEQPLDLATAVARARMAVIGRPFDEEATEWHVYAVVDGTGRPGAPKTKPDAPILEHLGSTLYERQLEGVTAVDLLREMAKDGALHTEISAVLGRGWLTMAENAGRRPPVRTHTPEPATHAASKTTPDNDDQGPEDTDTPAATEPVAGQPS